MPWEPECSRSSTEPAPALVSHRSAQGLDTTESAVDHLLAELLADVEFLHDLHPIEGFGVRDPWEQPKSVHEADDMGRPGHASTSGIQQRNP